jgi:hypothetical protein
VLQLVQSTLRSQIRVRRAAPRSELLHQLQQVQDVLLANVPSLTALSRQTDWDNEGVMSFKYGTSLLRSLAERWYCVSVAVSIRRRASVGSKTYQGSQQGTRRRASSILKSVES